MPAHEPMILAIDQGTTNSKAILVDRHGEVRGQASRPVSVGFPAAGWVEQDAQQLWTSIRESIDECLASAEHPPLAALGISNQRESGLAWDRASGRPLGPLVSWQCRRSAAICEQLRQDGHEDDIRARSGLPLDPMFTAGKWRWLLDDIPDGQARAAAGEICLGTVDSWLLWNVSGGRQHRTDVTNASRTLLFDLVTRSWDPVLLGHFGIPASALPEVSASAASFGETVSLGELPAGVPVNALIGDSHAALFGHASFARRSVKATYGTGSSLMMATGAVVQRAEGLASTVAWGLGTTTDARGTTTYALEGNIYATGAAVRWTADLLGLSTSGHVAELATQSPSSLEVYLVPAFVGLGAPYWDDAARGMLSGLTGGTGRGQLARAAIDAIAYQVRDVFEAMRAVSHDGLGVLLADGGATRNDQLMQFQADLLGIPVQRNDTSALSAMGASYLAGLAAGTWASTDEIEALPRSVDRFDPAMREADRAALYQGWQAAVARARFRPS